MSSYLAEVQREEQTRREEQQKREEERRKNEKMIADTDIAIKVAWGLGGVLVILLCGTIIYWYHSSNELKRIRNEIRSSHDSYTEEGMFHEGE
jgi:hypothetical protein